MSILTAPAPTVNPGFAPITAADLKRAAYFKLRLPAVALEAPAFVATPLPVVSVELIDLVEDGFAYRARLALALAAVEAPAPVVSVRTTAPRPADVREMREWLNVRESAPSAAVEPTPVKLAIHGHTYTVKAIPIDPSIGSVAYEVHKIDANVTYHAHLDGFGEVRCSCPDWEYRRAGSGVMCKHGRALVAAGLISINPVILPPSKPVVEPSGFASDEESMLDLTPFASRLHAMEAEDVHMGVKGCWVPITPQASVFKPTVRDRIEYPAPRARRYEPSADERGEWAQLSANLEAERAEGCRREYASIL